MIVEKLKKKHYENALDIRVNRGFSLGGGFLSDERYTFLKTFDVLPGREGVITRTFPFGVHLVVIGEFFGVGVLEKFWFV